MSDSGDGESCTVWFNPGCSKCRGARDLLAERGVDASFVHYLDDAPQHAEIERVMQLLGIDDPRLMMRTGEEIYRSLAFDDVTPRDDLIDAMVRYPILIERPIVIRGDRAVIARPPERALELFE